MGHFLRDLRFTARLIRRRPASSLVIILTLAVGIGGNTTMFVAFDAWVLRPLDFENAGSLVALRETRLQDGEAYSVSPANLHDWQAESRSFTTIAPFRRTVLNLQDRSDPEQVHGARVAASLFPLLGINPILGRHFLPEEDRPGGAAVALISDTLYQRRFDADPGILGRTIRLDDRLHEVVGVMPPGFEFPEWADVWTPLALPPAGGERGDRRLSTVARLRPGLSIDDARAEMLAIGTRLEHLHPATNDGWSVGVRPLRDEWAPPVIRVALTAAMFSAVFVLLIICANVANLTLVQAVGRRRELALRSALGASRGRLARMLLIENVVLAVLGGGLGAVLGGWWFEWMNSWAPIEVPYLFRSEIDGQALVFTLAIAIVAGTVCALAPIMRSSGIDIVDSLKSGSPRTLFGGKSRRLQNWLVAGQFAATMLLLVGTLLMIRSFLHEQTIEPGYRSDGILTMRLSLTGEAYDAPERRTIFLGEALQAIAGLGEVESVAATDYLPVSRAGVPEMRIEAQGLPGDPGREPLAATHSVTRNYLETMEIPILEGRTFTGIEEQQQGAVVLISRNLARRLWPEGSALQRLLRIGGGDESRWLRVIGVVGDIDPGRSLTNTDWPDAQVYLPYSRASSPIVRLVVRGAADPESLMPLLREQVRRTDPGVPVDEVVPMSRIIDEVHWVSRMFTKVFSLYAAIALGIACLGVYGITADMVSRRTHEMGLRLALGAPPAGLLRRVLLDALTWAAIGIGLGLLAAIAGTRFIATLLYQVSPNDPMVFGGVVTLLIVAALLAAWLPARRASRVDPMEVLRGE